MAERSCASIAEKLTSAGKNVIGILLIKLILTYWIGWGCDAVINKELFEKIYKNGEFKKMTSEIRILQRELVESNKQLEKYKIAIKYFQDNGDQPTRDIIKNLLSY